MYNSISLRALAVFVAASLMTGGALNALAASTSQKSSSKSHTSAQVKNPIDVNSADVKALEELPGIGSTLANRIVAGRPYNSLADLGKVKGMSQSKLDAIKDSVTFGPATAATKETHTGKKETAKKEKTPAKEKTTKSTETAQSTAGGQSAGQPQPSPTGKSSGSLAPGQRININTATAEQLDALPGIGPTKAQAIIDYRNQHGRFKSIDEIKNVTGIKEGEFSKIQDHIKVTN